MSNILEYKGYHSKIVFDAETFSIRGRIEGIDDYVDFESDTLENIEKEFHTAVDDYLEFCAEVGKTPEKEYKGTFNVRIDPKLHRAIAIDAMKAGTSLNATVEKAIKYYLSETSLTTQSSKSYVRVPTELIQEKSRYINYENYSLQDSRVIPFDPNYMYNCLTKVVNH